MTIITEKKTIKEILTKKLNSKLEEFRVCCKNSTQVEFCYFIASLNFTNVREAFQSRGVSDKIIRITNTDTFKYIISSLIKYGNISTEVSPPFNLTRINELIGRTKELNSFFQSLNFLELFNTYQYNTETEQLKISIQELGTSEETEQLNLYGIRIQEHLTNNLNLKQTTEIIDELFNKYMLIDDLIQEHYGFSLKDIKNMFNTLIMAYKERFEEAFYKFILDNEDLIDHLNIFNHLHYTKLLVFNKSQLDILNPKLYSFLGFLSFDSNEFILDEMRYHYIDKKPVIKVKDMYLISLELLFQGIQTHIHYELLETKNLGERYKKRLSSCFEDEISQIASFHGFRTIDKNKYLYDGKKELGDIDLIVESENGELLYIEAKCHALHSSVQAHDPIEMKRSLGKQRKDWESKVQARIDYLNNENSCNFRYIIVTKNPEILSHFSKLLVLSIQEFDYWLSGDCKLTFDKICDELYDKTKSKSLDLTQYIYPNMRFERQY